VRLAAAIRRQWVRPLLVAALTALALIVVSGCGSDGGEESSDGDGEGTTRLVVEAEEGAFDPQAIYEAVSDGVVTVRSSFEDGSTSVLIPDGPQLGQGSGFVVSDDGEIVTNAHVVTDGDAGEGGDITPADEVFIQFADRNQVAAEVIGFDPFADVALLQVDADGVELEPLELGSAGEVEVGDPVAAIGSPFGQQQSLSIGVVSAADRSIQSLTRFTIDGAIQTDASINPGNSGGPLLDAEGNVIGINQQINTRTGANEGVGFAVPIDLARRAIGQLREDGEVAYAYMGVESRSLYPQLAERLNLDIDAGALIVEVTPGSPAEDAGLEGGDEEITFQGVPVEVGGDVIVAIDGEPLVDDSDLPRRVALLEPGEEVTLEIIRDGERRDLDITLGERSSDIE